MSLAVFTDSTTAQASPALTLRPTSGNSTNTMSVNSCCAWSVMPTVAVSPLTRTHSCDLAYFKSEGMLLIILGHKRTQKPQNENNFCALCVPSRQLILFVNWLFHHDCCKSFAANFNFNLRVRLGKLWRDIAHTDANVQRRALRSARDN